MMKITPFLLALSLSAMTLAPSYAKEETPLKDGNDLVAEIASKITNIDTKSLQKEIESNPDLVLVDIRTFGEIRSMGGAIDAPQNVNIPRGWLEFRIKRHAENKDTPIAVYCGGNIRSPLAAYSLQQLGYTNVKNYANGYLDWKKQGLPVAKP